MVDKLSMTRLTVNKEKLKRWIIIAAVVLFMSSSVLLSNRNFSNTHDKMANLKTIDTISLKKLASEKEAQANSKIPILVYHHFVEAYKNSDSDFVLSREDFKEQMEYLHSNGYKTISSKMLNDYLEGACMPWEKNIIITFDDGYRSVMDIAYPILKNYSFTGIAFIITGNIGSEKDIPKLKYKDMISITDVFEFGSHTNSLHTSLNNIGSFISSSRDIVLKDLNESKENLNTDLFAYPFGEYTDETISLLKDSGFKLGFCTANQKATKSTEKFIIPRISINKGLKINDFVKFIEE